MPGSVRSFIAIRRSRPLTRGLSGVSPGVLPGVLAAALVAAAAAPAGALVIRDDKPDSDYTTLAAATGFNAVGQVKDSNNPTEVFASGVLISKEWVLSVAHAPVPPAATRVFEIGGETRSIDLAINHPMWGGAIENGFDLRLLKLTSPIHTIQPATLADGTETILGEPVTISGPGETGNGNTGNIIGSHGTLRAGQNILDRTGGTFTVDQEPVTFSNNVAWADFDDPPGGTTAFNHFTGFGGSNTPQDLETLIAFGDSGSGFFVDEGNGPVLIAVGSIVLLFPVPGTATADYGYGNTMGATLVNGGLPWITSTALPTLLLGDANNDLLVNADDLITVQQHFGSTGTNNGTLLGDANDDGTVTSADFIAIQQNFGNIIAGPAGLTSTLGVPEPGTGIALLAAAAVTALARRSRRPPG